MQVYLMMSFEITGENSNLEQVEALAQNLVKAAGGEPGTCEVLAEIAESGGQFTRSRFDLGELKEG